MIEIAKLALLPRDFSLLYVEDEEIIRDELVDFLETEAEIENLFVAKDGQEGLEMFKKHSPDIVVTDIKMPKLNGLKMSKSIKEISPNIPIIITTAFSDIEYFMESIEMKIDKYVTKPIDIEVLMESINQIKKSLFRKKEVETQYKIIKFMLDSNPNFMFMIQNRKIVYINKPFLSYLGFNNLNEFKDKESSICKFMSNSKLIIGPSSGPLHYASLCGLSQIVWSEPKNRDKYLIHWNPFKTYVTFYSKKSWSPSVQEVYNLFKKHWSRMS